MKLRVTSVEAFAAIFREFGVGVTAETVDSIRSRGAEIFKFWSKLAFRQMAQTSKFVYFRVVADGKDHRSHDSVSCVVGRYLGRIRGMGQAQP